VIGLEENREHDYSGADDVSGEDDNWYEQLLEDDEISSVEAAFIEGYREAEEEGFD